MDRDQMLVRKQAVSGSEWIVAIRSLLLKCFSRKMDVAAIPMA